MSADKIFGEVAKEILKQLSKNREKDFKMPLTIGWAAEMFQAWKDSGGSEDAYLNFTNLGNGVWAIQDYTE